MVHGYCTKLKKIKMKEEKFKLPITHTTVNVLVFYIHLCGVIYTHKYASISIYVCIICSTNVENV
jgi:hypothetical protein